MNATRKKRALVVDDQPDVANALKIILEFEGFEVRTANNAREGLELFRPQDFTLVFTDFDMPGMNGHEFACSIKARNPDQSIIMVTAYADSLVQTNKIPQVDAVVGKPFSLAELRAAILTATSRH